MASSTRIVVGLVAILLLAGAARADGMKFPLKGTIDLPELTSQQAIITFRDGEETIVVTDRYKTDSPQVAWILPIPAEPTSLTIASPSELEILEANLQPDIRGSEPQGVFGALVVLGVVLLIVAVWRYGGKQRVNLLFGVFCMLLASVLFTGVFTATLGIDLMKGGAAVVVSGERVGSYDVAVLRAANAKELDVWLVENGFEALGAVGQGIAQDYIDAGWVFVTAKLAASSDQELSAHPLAVTFPTSRPVYPMRLTALAGEPLTLDLYVVADGTAGCGPLEAVVAEQFDTSEWHDALGHGWPRATGRSDHYQRFGPQEQIEIVMPSLTGRLWDECMVTRLMGRVTPEQMSEDISITIGEAEVFRRKYVTPAIRLDRTMSEGIYWLAMWLGIAQCMLGKGCRPRFRGAGWVTLIAFVGIFILAGAAYRRSHLPPVSVATPSIQDAVNQFYGEELYRNESREHFVAALKDMLQDRTRITPSSFVQEMDELAVAQSLVNMVTGEPIQYGPTPGNWVLMLGGAYGVDAVFYDRFGQPHEFFVPMSERPMIVDEPGPAER